MSEIGLIRGQYEKLATTTDDVNNAIIILKKEHKLSKDPANISFIVSKHDMAFARKTISGIIGYLLKLSNDNSIHDYSIIPKRVVDRFKKEKIDFLQSDKKLKAIDRKITAEGKLDEDQLKLLDNIVIHLDIERSTLFKKLRTARG